ncbi:hypothetical protein AAMO2058_001616600 [Amorphochlora amoebiformis]
MKRFKQSKDDIPPNKRPKTSQDSKNEMAETSEKECVDIIQRYYSEYFSLGKKATIAHDYTGLDQYVQHHTNGLIVIGLAPSHPVLQQGKTAIKVTWDYKAGNNKVRGKHKKGAMLFEAHTCVCTIECSDGSKYCVRAGVRGKLIEINDQLDNNPSLIVTRPRHEGYIAIFMQNKKQRARLTDYVVDGHAYAKHRGVGKRAKPDSD